MRLQQEAVLRSAEAGAMLKRLCDQLRDRFPVHRVGTEAVVRIGPACCRFCAAGDRLVFCCEAQEEPALARMRALLEAHLGCCAGAGAGFAWAPPQRAAAGGAADIVNLGDLGDMPRGR
jgi:hypothetical protein